MLSYIKENPSLVAALALPILFAGFFFLSKTIGQSSAPPPKYDFVLAQANNYGAFDISVVDGALRVRFTYPRLDSNPNYAPQISLPELYYVDAKTMIAERITVDIPTDAANPATDKQGSSVILPVKKFEGKTFSSARISPDGYELSEAYYSGGNLMTEIFSSNHINRNSASLIKDGARVEVRGLGQNYGLTVIGWVIPESEKNSAP